MIPTHPSPALTAVAILGLIWPYVTSLLMRANWSASVAGFITIVLNGGTAFIAEWGKAGDAYNWRNGVSMALSGLVASLLTRYLHLRGTPLDAKLVSIGSKGPAQ